MTPSWLGLAVAQLMPKPGAGRAMARLLRADDLPDGEWGVLNQRTWRTGMTGPSTDWGRRARAARCLTAYRSFMTAAGQGCWVQVIALASESDALSAMDEIGGRVLRSQSSRTKVLREQDVTIDLFPGAARVWAHEIVATTPYGEAATKLVGAAVGSQVIAICASGSPGWAWDAVIAIASRQAAGLLAVA